MDKLSTIPEGLPPEATASLRAEHVDAFRTGRPFGVITLDLSCFSNWLDARCIAYADGVVAWADRIDSRTVYALDLRTGFRRSLVPEDRSSVTDIGLSSSMIAVSSTSGKCHVWTTPKEERFSFRLPSAQVKTILVSGSTLAISWPPVCVDNTRKAEILIWDLSTQRTSSFFIALSQKQSQHRENKMILDGNGGTLFYFERMFEDDSREMQQIFFKRTNLSGHILGEGVLDLALDTTWHDISGSRNNGVGGTVTPWAFADMSNPTTVDDPNVLQVSYNFKKGNLVSQVQRVDDLDKHDVRTSEFFFWKDVVYMFGVSDELGIPADKISIIDLRESSLHRIDVAAMKIQPQLWAEIERSGPLYLFGDENLILVLHPLGLIAWSFDKHLRLAAEDVEENEG
jgi:hypothetical protein